MTPPLVEFIRFLFSDSTKAGQGQDEKVHPVKESSLSEKPVDSNPVGLHQERRLQEQKDDSREYPSMQASHISNGKDDSETSQAPQNGRPSHKISEKSTVSEESDAKVAKNSGTASSVSISDIDRRNITPKDKTLIDTDTEEVEREPPAVYRDSRPIEEIQAEAGRYATLLDGPKNKRWMGKLVECIRAHPADIRHLAVIDTLYHTCFPDFRGKPRAPGGWFCSACEKFAKPGANIAQAVRLWAETGLSYEQVETAFQQGQKTPLGTPLPRKDEEPRLSDALFSKDSPLPEVGESDVANSPSALAVYSAKQLRTRMDAEQARALKNEINTTCEQDGIRAYVQKGPQGNCLVVTIWETAVVEHVNEAAWKKYYTGVKRCLQLKEAYRMKREGQRHG